jgi:hypothetical protein
MHGRDPSLGRGARVLGRARKIASEGEMRWPSPIRGLGEPHQPQKVLSKKRNLSCNGGWAKGGPDPKNVDLQCLAMDDGQVVESENGRGLVSHPQGKSSVICDL